jgi:hypothetical protein
MIHYLFAWLLAFIPPDRAPESVGQRARRLLTAWGPIAIGLCIWWGLS